MTRTPNVHQVLATLGYGDAIGHEVLGIQRALRGAGFTSDIFIETVDPRLERCTRDYRELIANATADDVLIHHFSIGSRASRVAFALPSRMVLVYHNITPPHYFVGVNKELVKLCYRGRRELAAYSTRCELALGDSEFNRQELEALGFPLTAVLPVVPDFAHLGGGSNRFVVEYFDDDQVNVLFVGRVIPNKRFEDVIRFFSAYRRHYNARSRLLFVGGYSGFEAYLAQLHRLAAALDVSSVVHFAGHVSNEELVAYYEAADLFLSASEHEGFCVPIVEAFYKQIPVAAYAAAAVPSTMDGGGVLYETKEPLEVAALMHALTTNDALIERVVAAQNAALARLAGRDFTGLVIKFIEEALNAPRRAYQVAWDFWQQFEAAEQLRALRAHRPSAYLALPMPPVDEATGARR